MRVCVCVQNCCQTILVMTIQRRATTICFFKYIFTHFETIVGKLASVLRQRKKNVLNLEIFLPTSRAYSLPIPNIEHMFKSDKIIAGLAVCVTMQISNADTCK